MKPIYDALDETDPQLRWQVAQALKQYKAKHKTPEAA
jgi:HEAT repeat protein